LHPEDDLTWMRKMLEVKCKKARGSRQQLSGDSVCGCCSVEG
jgi:hypothetical protein